MNLWTRIHILWICLWTTINRISVTILSMSLAEAPDPSRPLGFTGKTAEYPGLVQDWQRPCPMMFDEVPHQVAVDLPAWWLAKNGEYILEIVVKLADNPLKKLIMVELTGWSHSEELATETVNQFMNSLDGRKGCWSLWVPAVASSLWGLHGRLAKKVSRMATSGGWIKIEAGRHNFVLTLDVAPVIQPSFSVDILIHFLA